MTVAEEVGSWLRLQQDVAELAAIERASATPGERASAEWVAGRLRECGASDVRLEPFRYQRNWAWAFVAHHVAGLAATRLGRAPGAALAAAAAVSFELHVSGRSQWVSRFLPAGEGTNVVARVPAAGERRRTLVLVAHHDAAHTGLLWTSLFMRHADRRAWERGGADQMSLTPELALGLIATGTRVGRATGAALLLLSSALALDVARSAVVPGANDNATGVAAVLALVEELAASPLDGTEVVVVVPGCEEVGLGGMVAWLAGADLDPASTLVVNLDTLGSGTPVVVSKETPVLGRYREADLAWVDRGALRAGVARPPRFRLALTTDAIVASVAGIPAVSITSKDRDGRYPNYHLPSDTPEHVDWDSVEACRALAAGVARAFSEG